MNNIRQYLLLSSRYERGLTLLEILVALMISAFLIAGVIQLFIGSKQTYRFYDAMSRLQENGRLALDTMAMDIRMADYQYPKLSPQMPPSAANCDPAEVCGIASDAVEGIGNDIITVRWTDPNQCLPNPPGNCSRRFSVQPRTVGGTAPTCPTAGTSLFFQRQADAAPQELIEGVQAMQILYGVCDTDADGDGRKDTVTTPPGYVTAANVAVAKWPNVCSVRIYLLLVSLENNIVTQPQTVFFPPDTNTPVVVGDHCLRQAFSTTVAIRNRIP